MKFREDKLASTGYYLDEFDGLLGLSFFQKKKNIYRCIAYGASRHYFLKQIFVRWKIWKKWPSSLEEKW